MYFTDTRDSTSANQFRATTTEVAGGYVCESGGNWYKVSNCHLMPEVFVGPVSAAVQSMSVSSRSALSAGWRNSDVSQDKTDVTNLSHYVLNSSASLQEGDLAENSQKLRQTLPARMTVRQLRALVKESGDHEFIRIVIEYLLRTFGRRNGDPTVPWASFSIELQNNDGLQKPGYDGNWRDIFKNWEALALACADYMPGVQIDRGLLRIALELFEDSEFLKNDDVFGFYDLHDSLTEYWMTSGDFGFTVRQVPVISTSQS